MTINSAISARLNSIIPPLLRYATAHGYRNTVSMSKTMNSIATR
jgi:hypothetical protein